MRILSEHVVKSPSRLLVEVFIGAFFLFAVVLVVFWTSPLCYRPIRTSCLSNVKQLMTGVMMYASDENDACPPYFTFDRTDNTRKFYGALQPYVKNKSLQLCPFDTKTTEEDFEKFGFEGIRGFSSYVHCLELRLHIPGFGYGMRNLRFGQLSSPATVGFLRDPIRSTVKERSQAIYRSPQESGFSVGFADGHAKFISDIKEAGAL